MRIFSKGREPEGIGGWLLLPLLGLFWNFFTLLLPLATVYLPIFREGYWHLFLPWGGAFFHLRFFFYFLFDALGRLLLAVCALYLLDLFLRKDRRLPRRIIGFYLGLLIFSLLDLFLVVSLLQVGPGGGGREETMIRVVLATVRAFVWIPYFFRSRRVRNTFVHEFR